MRRLSVVRIEVESYWGSGIHFVCLRAGDSSMIIGKPYKSKTAAMLAVALMRIEKQSNKRRARK